MDSGVDKSCCQVVVKLGFVTFFLDVFHCHNAVGIWQNEETFE